jgi:phage terminase large subunit-like protein
MGSTPALPRSTFPGRTINQGWKLCGAIKTAERKLADRTLLHGGQDLMAWAVGNARVELKGNAIVITK